jgi:hypothetical protein
VVSICLIVNYKSLAAVNSLCLAVNSMSLIVNSMCLVVNSMSSCEF